MRGKERVKGGTDEGRRVWRVVLMRGKERVKGGPNEGEGECGGWS